MPPKTQCIAKTVDGTRCKLKTSRDNSLCHVHGFKGLKIPLPSRPRQKVRVKDWSKEPRFDLKWSIKRKDSYRLGDGTEKFERKNMTKEEIIEEITEPSDNGPNYHWEALGGPWHELERKVLAEESWEFEKDTNSDYSRIHPEYFNIVKISLKVHKPKK